MLHCNEQTIRHAISRRVVFIWMLFGFLALQLQGQQLFFDQFSVSEGLAQSKVYKVIQDENDIFWLGTDAGVSRFDGLGFTNLSAENGLAANGVRAISEDGNGNIWLGHIGGGVSRYNGQSFEVLNTHEFSLNSDVTSILLDSVGHLWLTTFGSGVIEVMNPQAPMDELELLQHSGRELSDRFVGGYVDGTGKIYFVSDINVKYYNRDSARFDNLQMNGIPTYYTTTCILVDSRGSTWFGKYNGGLYRYDPDLDNAEMYDLIKAGLTSNWVSTIFEDKGGNIWAGTWGGGMVRVSPENDLDLFSDRNGLPGMKIRTIMEDREGNILVGTHENGLCVYKGDHFTSYFIEDGLIDSQVWSIQQTNDGEIWFGTNGGISILNQNAEGEEFKEFNELKGLSIGFLKEDQNETMWIGSFTGCIQL